MASKTIKNKNILKANPKGQANMAFIKALYKERGGYKPTENEMRKFEHMNIGDVMNTVLGKGAAKQLPMAVNPTLPPTLQPDTTQSPTINPTPTQPDWTSQIASLLQPTQPVKPTFDQSGLFNEADVNAQAQAEYSPYFSEALADLVKGTQRQTGDVQREQTQFGTDFARQQQALGQAQTQQTGNQLSDYLNRGLSRSGGLVGAQQQLGQEQGLATQKLGEFGTEQNRQFGQRFTDITDEEARKKKELVQQKKSALEGYRNDAYTRAYNQYLGR